MWILRNYAYTLETQMKKKRRNHSTCFKARVALDALKGDKTLAYSAPIRSLILV